MRQPDNRPPIFVGRHLVAALGFLALLACGAFIACDWMESPAGGQVRANIDGTIDGGGYHVPAGIPVAWRQACSIPPCPADRIATLNPDIQWNGSNAGGDPLPGCHYDEPGPQCQADPRDPNRGYICRYGNCDSSLLGRQISAIGSEQGGATEFPGGILDELFKAAGGPHRVPTRQEEWDFRIANYSGSRSVINPCERDAQHPFGRRYQVNGPPRWSDWEKALGRCYPERIAGWQSTLGPECWSACLTPDGLPPAVGPGPDPTPASTATLRATPCPCGSSPSGAGGVVVCNDCPPPAPTPTPPGPAATPCPPPPPCPTCKPPPSSERMPVAIRATVNKGLSSLGRQWQASVAAARAWLDAHPYYLPNDNRSTGQLKLTLEPEPTPRPTP
jgi:hypothetical protein